MRRAHLVENTTKELEKRIRLCEEKKKDSKYHLQT